MKAPLYDSSIRRKRDGHYPWFKQIPRSALGKRNDLTFSQKRDELNALLASNTWAREKIAA